MKCLIIGSKGFIGSECLSCLSDNYEVWGCDVVHDYVTPRYLVVDSSNANFEEIIQSQDFDVCLNCSGAASVPESLKSPLRDYQLNVVNVFKMLEALRKHRPQCKFLNISSAAVYGNPTTLPTNESHPLMPLSPYGRHKLQAEQICKEFFDFYEIPTVSLRVFSAYGSGLKKQLFWDLYQNSRNQSAIELYGTGNESRDFIHVKDIARAVDSIIQRSGFNGEVVNVAGGEEHYIRDVAKLFFKHIEWQGQVNYSGTVRPGDPLNWCADISLLKSYGYTKTMTMDSGLKELAEWLCAST